MIDFDRAGLRATAMPVREPDKRIELILNREL